MNGVLITGCTKSPLWKKMIANILNVEQECLESKQSPGMGGAMLAMVAAGEYNSVQEVCDKFVCVASIVKPDPALAAKYEARYQQFRKIYPSCCIHNLYKILIALLIAQFIDEFVFGISQIS